MGGPAARAYRCGMLRKAGTDKKISPHELHPTAATHRLNAGAERVDLQALLGHVHRATTQNLHPRGPGPDGGGGEPAVSARPGKGGLDS